MEELAEWELVALAEGIRDQHYRPVMEAQDEAKRLEERRRREEQEQQRTRVREDADRAEHQREEARRAAEPEASQDRARAAGRAHRAGDFAEAPDREIAEAMRLVAAVRNSRHPA